MRTLALVLGALCLAAPARAEQSAEDGPPAGDTDPSTLQALVEDLAGQVGPLIGDLPRPRMDLAVALRAELPQSSAQSRPLDQLILELLMGRLSREQPLRSLQAVSGEGWASASGARQSAAAQGFELLLWLEATIDRHHLVIEGMVFETEHHLWREAVQPERQVLGRIFCRMRINAELRGHLPPLPSRPLSSQVIPLGLGEYLAVAVGDLDGDDRAELVLLSRQTFEVRRLEGDQARVLTQLRLAGIPLAATRSRDPVGTVVIGPPDRGGLRPVAFRTSDHSQGVLVRFDGVELELGGTITDFPLRWSGELACTSITTGRSTFQTAPSPCGSLQATELVPPFFTDVEERLSQRSSPSAVARATALADGSVTLRWNDEVLSRIPSAGTALAITDVDDDGLAEVLLSSDREPGSGDELTIQRLGPEGASAAPERLGDIQGSVWVAASGDVDDDGLRELLAIAQSGSGAQLLVIE